MLKHASFIACCFLATASSAALPQSLVNKLINTSTTNAEFVRLTRAHLAMYPNDKLAVEILMDALGGEKAKLGRYIFQPSGAAVGASASQATATAAATGGVAGGGMAVGLAVGGIVGVAAIAGSIGGGDDGAGDGGNSQPPTGGGPSGSLKDSLPSTAGNVYYTPEFQAQWGLEEVGAYEFYKNYTKFGEGVIVSVFDTGIDTSHQELSGQVLPESYSYNRDSNVITDYLGHGTHVAGIIAAKRDGVGMHGVAPSAQLLGIQFIDSEVSYGSGETIRILLILICI